ncbi:PKD repeat-containing protein [Saccharicrinis carchari]|uniref:PKD repeat-containing protein n=2 Tax=Saccharicrinis carchari TaxID=1168039 RepID=A0A521B3T3_SACCC|nr:PKD repeat-containing protein [Saccharicrinis carchari]
MLMIATLVGYNACENDIKTEEFASEGVDFTYTSSSIHYVIGEEINFINKSILGTSFEWDFGDGGSSTERDPVYKYTEPGNYKVKLIVDGGEYQAQKNIMISDIVPVVTFSSTDPSIVYKQSEVSFDVQILNPENLKVSYQWTFPRGTQGEAIDDNFNSSAKSPTVTFGTIGSQKVALAVKLGEKNLDPINVNVSVNYDKPVKTLYYAVKEGNIMASKLIDGIDPALNGAFDMGFRSGKHPLSLQFSGDRLYVFDAGTFTGYVGADFFATAGDGEIFAIPVDGSGKENIINNFGGNTFLDFYYGYIDEEAGQIYWSDRRNGVMKIPISTRNSKLVRQADSGQPEGAEPYVFQNTWLGYYGNGISWGNQNGPFLKANGLWWWGKHTLGAGVFRFEEADILGRDRVESDPVPAAGRILSNRQIRGMVFDEANQVLYYSDQAAFRVRRYILSEERDRTIMNYRSIDNTDGEGGVEALFVTGMAIDGEYLYWAYRGPEVPEGVDPETFYTENPMYRSGIKRVPLADPVSANIEYYIEGVEAYGIAIDQTLR